jgi:hypothetical protein
MRIIDGLNAVSTQVWAALFILMGGVLYLHKMDGAAAALVSGGFALMQHKAE